MNAVSILQRNSMNACYQSLEQWTRKGKQGYKVHKVSISTQVGVAEIRRVLNMSRQQFSDEFSVSFRSESIY